MSLNLFTVHFNHFLGMEDTADGLSFRLGLLTSISSGYDLDHFNDDSDDVSILWKGIIFL